MDKRDFLHRFNGLRVFQPAGQALFLARTLTGQKKGSGQAGQFRTFDPVDMQGLIHSGAGFCWSTLLFCSESAAEPPLPDAGSVFDAVLLL